jgi:NADH-quinone oxidoreductase subunit C
VENAGATSPPGALQDLALATVMQQFPDEVIGHGEHAGQKWVEVKRERILDILRTLRDTHSFEMLMDLTAVDWLNKGMPERFSVVYILFSVSKNAFFRVRAWVPEDDPQIPTASTLWKSANWGEREVWDMFGIRFEGHPDLRRILMPDYYTGHPLQKDYPVKGRGERSNFRKIERGGS